jgi:hypothetical protein
VKAREDLVPSERKARVTGEFAFFYFNFDMFSERTSIASIVAARRTWLSSFFGEIKDPSSLPINQEDSLS